MPTYLDQRRGLIARFVRVAPRTALLAETYRRVDTTEKVADDWRLDAARPGWRRFSRPEPIEPRRGDLTLRDLYDVEAILCAVCWPMDPRRLEYEHRPGASASRRAVCSTISGGPACVT